MEFDVQKVDLDQLADVAQNGGIAALEELAATGKVTTPPAEEAAPKEDAAPTESAATDKEPATPEAPAVTQPDDKEDHGTAVANKSGKGVIPYAVLKGARDRASNLESENALLRKQMDELTARLNNPTDTPAAGEVAATTNDVDAKIAAMQAKAETLREDFPDLAELLIEQAEVMKVTRDELVKLHAGQQEVQQEREQARAMTEAEAAQAVQEAIDENPVLVAWQAKDGPEWEAALSMDNMLREKPEWAEKTFAERFAKVVELVKVMNPEFAVPETKATDVPGPTSTETKPQAPASNKPPVHSLSDIPGGVPPAAGIREQVEDMSAVALGNRFMDMSLEQTQAWLSSLGM